MVLPVMWLWVLYRLSVAKSGVDLDLQHTQGATCLLSTYYITQFTVIATSAADLARLSCLCAVCVLLCPAVFVEQCKREEAEGAICETRRRTGAL